MNADSEPNKSALEQILNRLRDEGFVQSGLVLKRPETGETVVIHELELRRLDASETKRLMRGN